MPKTFTMIGNFFRDLKLADENKLEVKNKDTLTLGKHELTFVFAPMGTLAGGNGNIR